MLSAGERVSVHFPGFFEPRRIADKALAAVSDELSSIPGLTKTMIRTAHHRASLVPTVLLVIGLIAGTDVTLACTGAAGASRVAAGVGTAHSSSPFPLRLEPGKRYLVDAAGRPFLIQGDASWSLIAQLTREEVRVYLDDRRARGFNTLLVNVLEHRFSSDPPKNAYGDAPFLTPGDFGTPNERYFAHADWVLALAAEKGFLVLLAPSYLGWEGGNQGWYAEMARNGSAKLREYGRYLGRRYKDCTNILWVHGGDYNPPDRSLVRAVAEGIRELDSRALNTASGGPETSALEYWRGESWLQVNSLYTYRSVYAAAREAYRDSERLPFFLLESVYENEHRATTWQLRAQAYEAVLSGAAGQVFGNNPIWSFGAPGLFPAPGTWREALGGPGSQSMTHLWTFLAPREWWRLVPDFTGAMLQPTAQSRALIDKAVAKLGGGPSAALSRPVAAVADDGSLAVAYLPRGREATIDLKQLNGPNVVARWYDPAGGTYTDVAGAPFPATAPRAFRPPGKNSAGDSDWVLVLESAR